jgi:hypothetical protein
MATDAGDTIVIRAEMLSDIPEEAAKNAAAVKAMNEGIASSSAAAGTPVEQLGKHLDTVNQRSEQVASGGAKKLKKAYEDLYESGGRLRESVAGVGESIKYHLQYPMQQVSYIMEGAAAGVVAFGLTTESSLQQAKLALTNFTGSASVAAGAVQQLRQMQLAVPLPGLESAYETLSQGGVSQAQLLPLIRGLSGISAVSLNPANSMQSMAAALSSMTSTGLMTTSDVNAFSSSGVDVWGMLAKETGQSPEELRMRFLRAGTPMAVPSGFTSDLMSSGAATGGTAAYGKTWAGQFEEMKKSAGDLLGVLETPLGNALAGAAGKIDTWAQGTEQRFKQLGGNLGSEWSSGNNKGLGNTLAQIVGDPKLAGDITTVGSGLHGLVNIVENSVIPMGKDMAHILNPAFQGFASTLDFLGHHQAVTEALIGTLGGFVVFSKIAQWTSNAVTAVRAFNAILEGKGMAAAISAYSRGLGGLAAAQESVATSAADETAAESVVGGRGGAGGLGGAGGVVGKLGMAAAGAGGAVLAYQGATSKHLTVGSGLETVGGAAATGAAVGSFIPVVGTGVGALLGGAFGVGDVGGRLLGGLLGGGHHTSIKTVNITVPGAGNPNKVANAIPKALNDQIVAQQNMAQRRGAA